MLIEIIPLAVLDEEFLLIGHYNKYADDEKHVETTIVPILQMKTIRILRGLYTCSGILMADYYRKHLEQQAPAERNSTRNACSQVACTDQCREIRGQEDRVFFNCSCPSYV